MIGNMKLETRDGVMNAALKKQVPLTDREIMDIWMQIAMVHGGTAVDFARALEHKHGIEGTKSH
jgi:hypothetical protein